MAKITLTLPSGIGGGGSGNVVNYIDLLDKTTVNLPTINTPLSNALNGKQNQLIAGTNINIDITNPLLPVISSAGGDGSTNLNYTPSPTQGTVVSDTGTDAIIPLADLINAGIITPAEKIKLNNTSGINSGNQTSIVGISGTKTQFNTAVTDGDILYVGDITQYTDELAQDAVGNILTDTTTIDFTYNDVSNQITADVKANSITSTQLADNINISEFINNSGYITNTNLAYTQSPTNGIVTSDTGTDATLPLADGTNAGLLKPEKYTVLENTSGTNTGDQDLSGKQDVLVSGTNIKTKGGISLLGAGDIPNSAKITTTVSITNATLTVAGDAQEGKIVKIDNGVNVINYTVNGAINASFIKMGTGAITFVQGSGRTLTGANGTLILNGAVNSTASIVSDGTVDTLYINNL